MELCKKKKKKKFQSINRDCVKKKESEYSTMFKIGEEEEHRQMGKISSNDVHSREAKISGGARSSLFYFFFSLSQSVLEGGDGKETREREGGMLSFTRRLSSSFLRSFRAWEEGFIAREAL